MPIYCYILHVNYDNGQTTTLVHGNLVDCTAHYRLAKSRKFHMKVITHPEVSSHTATSLRHFYLQVKHSLVSKGKFLPYLIEHEGTLICSFR